MRLHVHAAAGCVLALAIGCSSSDPGLTTSVKARLAADDTAKALKIDVDTKDRVVTLTGEVRTSEEEAKALQIARGTKGVTDVVDHLSVVPAEPTAATSGRLGETPTDVPAVDMTDPGITAAIKTKLLADPFVSGLKIDVDTKERVVTLKGVLPSQAEKDRALAIARENKSVLRVDDRLTLRKQ
jgi:hyperosmotically inducible periplasmic protein